MNRCGGQGGDDHRNGRTKNIGAQMEYLVIIIFAVALFKAFIPSKKNKTTSSSQKPGPSYISPTVKLASIPREFSQADFVAIDFETATSKRNSACSVGMVACRDGAVIGTYQQLLQPPDNEYQEFNINLHGITPEHTEDAPTIAELYKAGFSELLEKVQFAAHNASFDMSVLRSSLDHHGITTPFIDAVCTVELAREMYPDLPNHKLKTVAKHIKQPLQHHDPLSDATASAAIMMQWTEKRKGDVEKKRKQREIDRFINDQNDLFSSILNKARDLEQTDMLASSRMYLRSVNMMKRFDRHCMSEGIDVDRPRMAINRLTFTLEKSGLLKRCAHAIKWHEKYNDPIGLNNKDVITVIKRLERVVRKIDKNKQSLN